MSLLIVVIIIVAHWWTMFQWERWWWWWWWNCSCFWCWKRRDVTVQLAGACLFRCLSACLSPFACLIPHFSVYIVFQCQYRYSWYTKGKGI